MVSHILTNAKYFNLKYWTFKKGMHKRNTKMKYFLFVALGTLNHLVFNQNMWLVN